MLPPFDLLAYLQLAHTHILVLLYGSRSNCFSTAMPPFTQSMLGTGLLTSLKMHERRWHTHPHSEGLVSEVVVAVPCVGLCDLRGWWWGETCGGPCQEAGCLVAGWGVGRRHSLLLLRVIWLGGGGGGCE